jgi:hypothetical protein
MVLALGKIVLGVVLCVAESHEEPPLVPRASLVRLRGIVADAAKSGDRELVERLRSVLEGLGDASIDLERLQKTWDSSLASARPEKFDRQALARKLARELKPLRAQLETLEGRARDDLARWLLVLDSEDPSARAQLGYVSDGEEWLTTEELTWRQGAGRIEQFRAAATRLAFTVEHSSSTNPALAVVAGAHNRVSAGGVTIHSGLPPGVIERILQQALRAACFSNAILRDDLALPASITREFVFLHTDEVRGAVYDEAVASGGLEAEHRVDIERLDLRSFVDTRGWRTSRIRSEADFEALVLWDLMDGLLGADAQPCLRTGHLNWVCLNFLGTSMPFSAWLAVEEHAERTSSTASTDRFREGVWRAARQSLYGCRAFLVRAVAEGRDPAWARAMVDADGKIRDEVLLKTTLVCELLQVEGRLLAVCEATRKAGERVPAFEGALGETLPEFESRWRRWLVPSRPEGVVQSLMDGAPAAAESPTLVAGLRRLSAVRAAALRDPPPELGAVGLEPELSRMASAHARYLVRHPDLWTKWPDMHEQFPDREGFSPAGALAGNRSVIAFDTSPAEAIDAWMGTFYHRLPLLHPGLFGIGIGVEEGVVVLDSGSLVAAPWQDHVVLWPPPDAVRVPRRFVPEIPNPVPGSDQSSLGYPVTIQLFFRDPHQAVRLQAELLTEAGAPVECWFVGPDAPLFSDLVPQDAWCLIPKSHLAKRARYQVRAEWTGGRAEWRFTTGD